VDDANFTRPYLDADGKLVYLTDTQFVERQKHSPVRKLRAGEYVVNPEVAPYVQIAPNPATAGAQATDRGIADPVANPVPEVREREVR
jgi:hypothetical protein